MSLNNNSNNSKYNNNNPANKWQINIFIMRKYLNCNKNNKK